MSLLCLNRSECPTWKSECPIWSESLLFVKIASFVLWVVFDVSHLVSSFNLEWLSLLQWVEVFESAFGVFRSVFCCAGILHISECLIFKSECLILSDYPTFMLDCPMLSEFPTSANFVVSVGWEVWKSECPTWKSECPMLDQSFRCMLSSSFVTVGLWRSESPIFGSESPISAEKFPTASFWSGAIYTPCPYSCLGLAWLLHLLLACFVRVLNLVFHSLVLSSPLPSWFVRSKAFVA